MLIEMDYEVIKKSVLYDLRLMFSTSDKQNYTQQELVELMDKIALSKEKKK